MALLKVLVCFLLMTVAIAEEEDDGQYDPAKYEAPFITPEADEGTVESRETGELVRLESPVEAPVQPAEEAPVQPAEAPVQSAEAPVQPAEFPVQPAEAPVHPAQFPVQPMVQPAEFPVQPLLQPANSPVQPQVQPLVQPAESPLQPAVERLSEVKPSFPADVSGLAPSPIAPYPYLAAQQPLFPYIPQQISPYVSQQIAPFKPQEVAPFIYSGPQVLRIAAETFPSVTA